MRTWTAIAGAISPVGRREAAALAARGKDLVLIDEERRPLEALASELRVGYRVDVRICAVSFASADAAVHVERWLRERDLSIDGIVAVLAAGEPLRRHVEALIEALLPRMRSRGFGSVIRLEADAPASVGAAALAPRGRRTTAPGHGDPS